MKIAVYDAAVLVTADKGDRKLWSEHKDRFDLRITHLIPAPVLAQVSRSAQQAQLRGFLHGCEIVPMGEGDAYEVGRLFGGIKTTDIGML